MKIPHGNYEGSVVGIRFGYAKKSGNGRRRCAILEVEVHGTKVEIPVWIDNAQHALGLEVVGDGKPFVTYNGHNWKLEVAK